MNEQATADVDARSELPDWYRNLQDEFSQLCSNILSLKRHLKECEENTLPISQVLVIEGQLSAMIAYREFLRIRIQTIRTIYKF